MRYERILVKTEMAMNKKPNFECLLVSHFNTIAPLSLSYPSYQAVSHGKNIISSPSPTIPPSQITKRHTHPHVHRLQKCSLISPTAYPPFNLPNPPRL